MTIEFDKSGFAAVDALFGSDVEPEKKQFEQQIASSQRLGVGAKPVHKTHDPITNKILQVGRKRQRENEDHVEMTTFDKSPQEKRNNNDDDDDDDDEEDLGRTAIDSGTKIATVSAAEMVLQNQVANKKKKKKKKKGKKERAQEMQSTNKDECEQGSSKSNTNDDYTGLKSTNSNNDTDVVDQANENHTSSTKRKRRKVRSKQKNIYKDHREKKPEHLIIGSKNYQGRPITPETRAKLNLPARPKSVQAFSQTWTGMGATDINK